MASTRKPQSEGSPSVYHPPAPEPPPQHFAIIPAPPAPTDFTQQIIDLNKSVAALEAKTTRLILDVSEQDAKLETQSVRISEIEREIGAAKATVKGAFYTGKWFLAGIGILIGLIIGHLTALLSILHSIGL